MLDLAPRALTIAELKSIPRITPGSPRDHPIFSMALGAGLQLVELMGLDIADVRAPDGTPRLRVRICPEIA